MRWSNDDALQVSLSLCLYGYGSRFFFFAYHFFLLIDHIPFCFLMFIICRWNVYCLRIGEIRIIYWEWGKDFDARIISCIGWIAYLLLESEEMKIVCFNIWFVMMSRFWDQNQNWGVIKDEWGAAFSAEHNWGIEFVCGFLCINCNLQQGSYQHTRFHLW